MQDDSDSSARTPERPTGTFEKAERERDKATEKGTAVPMPDGAGDELIEKTGQGQGQSRGKPQTQPQE